MEFGSKYVYTYTDSEEESVSDDEFETGMDAHSWYCIILRVVPENRPGPARPWV